MQWVSPVELVGYAASALVVVSLAMTSVVRLRVISLVGSLTFVAYGVLIGSIPILITNAAIAGLNVWFLRRELGGQRDLGAVPIAADAPFLIDFLRSHASDIRQSQPGFGAPAREAFAVLLTRDGLPAGALVGRRAGADLHVDLDYVMQAYRDSRIGTWLYGPGASIFTQAGITRLIARPATTVHRGYLSGVGFTPEPAPDGERWVRRLG